MTGPSSERTADEEIVREALPHSPNEHHRNCNTHKGGECDCYGRWSNPAHEALDRMISYRQRFERHVETMIEPKLLKEMTRLRRRLEVAELCETHNAEALAEAIGDVEETAA